MANGSWHPEDHYLRPTLVRVNRIPDAEPAVFGHESGSCGGPSPPGVGGRLGAGLRSSPMPDRRTPFLLAGEKETLRVFLDYLRESLILKVADLDEESARRSTVPTGTSLLGLIKHLIGVEVGWFQFAFAGRDVAMASEEVEPTDSVASAVTAYRAATE